MRLGVSGSRTIWLYERYDAMTQVYGSDGQTYKQHEIVTVNLKHFVYGRSERVHSSNVPFFFSLLLLLHAILVLFADRMNWCRILLPMPLFLCRSATAAKHQQRTLNHTKSINYYTNKHFSIPTQQQQQPESLSSFLFGSAVKFCRTSICLPGLGIRD